MSLQVCTALTRVLLTSERSQVRSLPRPHPRSEWCPESKSRLSASAMSIVLVQLSACWAHGRNMCDLSMAAPLSLDVRQHWAVKSEQVARVRRMHASSVSTGHPARQPHISRTASPNHATSGVVIRSTSLQPSSRPKMAWSTLRLSWTTHRSTSYRACRLWIPQFRETRPTPGHRPNGRQWLEISLTDAIARPTGRRTWHVATSPRGHGGSIFRTSVSCLTISPASWSQTFTECSVDTSRGILTPFDR